MSWNYDEVSKRPERPTGLNQRSGIYEARVRGLEKFNTRDGNLPAIRLTVKITKVVSPPAEGGAHAVGDEVTDVVVESVSVKAKPFFLIDVRKKLAGIMGFPPQAEDADWDKLISDKDLQEVLEDDLLVRAMVRVSVGPQQPSKRSDKTWGAVSFTRIQE